MAKDMDSSNRMHHSNDALMDEAIARLEGIDSGRHRDTAKYKKVLEAIDELHRVSSPFYEKPIGDKQNLEQIQQAYRELVSACDAYAEGKGDKRQSEFGTQRLNSVRAIRDLAQMDAAIFDEKVFKDAASMNVSQLLTKARSITAVVEDPKEISTVGANASSRIPLEVNRGNSPKQGFFTESKINDTDGVIIGSLVHRFEKSTSMSPLHNLIARAVEVNEGTRLIGALAGIDKKHSPLSNSSGSKGIFGRKSRNDVMTEGMESFRQTVFSYMSPVPNEFRSTESFRKWLTTDPSIIPALNALSKEMGSRQESCKSNRGGGIEDGKDVPSRNIGMSRCAEMLGCQGLIAKADRMMVQIDGELKTGVFMEKAEGSDIKHLHPSDPLVALFHDKKKGLEVFSGSFKRDLANIQVIDYICGNPDRHLANMIYQTGTDENGHLRVTGVVGIDNDLSFGNMPGGQLYFRPDNFRVMTRDTFMMVMSMDKAFLDNISADLDLGDAEKQQMLRRVMDLQDYLRISSNTFDFDSSKDPVAQLPDQKGTIIIVNDEKDLERIPFESLVVNPTPGAPEGHPESKGNIFCQERYIPQNVRGKAAGMLDEVTPINYAKAALRETAQASAVSAVPQGPQQSTPLSAAQAPQQPDTGLSPDQKPLRFTPESVAAEKAFQQSTPQPTAQAPQQSDTGLSPDQKPLRFTPESVAAAKAFQQSTPQPAAQAPRQRDTGLSPDQKPLRFTPESVAAAKAFNQSTPQPSAQAPQQRDTGLSPDQKPLRFTPESVAAAKAFNQSTPQSVAQAPQQRDTGLSPDQKPLRFTPESVAAAKASAKTSGPNENTRTKIDLKTLEAKTPKSESALRAEALAERRRSRSYSKPPVPQSSISKAAGAHM